MDFIENDFIVYYVFLLPILSGYCNIDQTSKCWNVGAEVIDCTTAYHWGVKNTWRGPTAAQQILWHSEKPQPPFVPVIPHYHDKGVTLDFGIFHFINVVWHALAITTATCPTLHKTILPHVQSGLSKSPPDALFFLHWNFGISPPACPVSRQCLPIIVLFVCHYLETVLAWADPPSDIATQCRCCIVTSARTQNYCATYGSYA